MNTFTSRLVPAAALATVVLALALGGCTATSPMQSLKGAASKSDSPAAEHLASYRSPRCVTSQLRGTLVDNGGAAAGSIYEAIQLNNVGTSACTLQGWPGVSFVRDDTGAQIGAAAAQDRSTLHATVTIGAGKSAIAPLRIADALNYPTKSCKPTSTDEFRVYPPGERAALLVHTAPFGACASSKEITLTVSAVRPVK
jgi:hypothetical protein